MAYLYETHLHTAPVSKCASSRGRDYIAGYIDKGYTGIFVTDHFYNGNCGISKSLPWKEWVKQFCRGYENAREEGEKQGLDVFFGWEETFDGGDDYLVYGLDKEWLMEHPEMRTWTRGEQYRKVKEAGGCVVQAHPFRQRYYIPHIVLSTGCVDAVEAANFGNDISFDVLAYRYAQKMNLPMTAGSDIHDASHIYGGEVYGVYLKEKLESSADFTKAVCNNGISGIKTEEDRFFDFGGSEKNVIFPVQIRDKNDKVISKSIKGYI